MKNKAERTSRDRNEKRRLLLNKNYELSHSFDNEKLGEDSLTTQAGSSAARLDGAVLRTALTKRMRAIIALLVALAVVVPTMVFVGIHPKASGGNTFAEMESIKNATEEASVTLTNSYQHGTYYFTYGPENRTYKYELTTDLIPGDTLTLYPDTKVIKWTHSPAQEGTSLDGLATVTPGDNGKYTITVSDTKALARGTTYFFEDNDKFYMFTIDGEGQLGKKPSEETNDGNWATREDANDLQKDQIVIEYDTSGNTTTKQAVFSDASYTLRRETVYEKTTNKLTNNGVYLVTATVANTEYAIQYDESAAITLTNFYDGDNSTYTVYPITNLSVEPVDSITDGDETLTGSFIVSSNRSFDDYKSSEFIARSAGATFTKDSNQYYYLYGTTTAGDVTTYTDTKALTNPYAENNAFVYVSNYSGQTSKGGIFGIGTQYFDDRLGAVWHYSNGTLSNLNGTTYTASRRTYNSNEKGAYLGFYNNRYVMQDSSALTEIKIYERKDIYNKTTNLNDTIAITAEEKTTSSDYMNPRTITYDDPTQGSTDTSTVTKGGLVMDKSVVPDEDDEDLFHVTLDAHAEGEELSIPPTDIELVLDRSKKMSETLYKRNYENLKTYQYSAFADRDDKYGSYSLENVKHDDLFDEGTVSDNGFMDLFGAVLSEFMNRNFKLNKYVEDPFAPGTYVYLHQEYSSDVSASAYKNHYTYYFTSSNGKTYKTNTQDVIYYTSPTEWVGDIQRFRAKINSLSFYDEATNEALPNPITKIYKRQGDTDEGNQTNPGLVKNLLAYGTGDASTTRLRVKDRDGNYVPVTLETLDTGKWYRFKTTIDNKDYIFETGNKTKYGDLGMYQGFRYYEKDAATGELKLSNGKNNWLSKTLYITTDEQQNVTALQAMQEALEDFLLSAHEKAVKNHGNIYIGLTVYSRYSDNNPNTKVIYSINANDCIDVKKSVGEKSIDEMIITIYNLTIDNTYASEVDKGMDVAYNDMNTYKKPDSKRYTLLFTNGMPIRYKYWGTIWGDVDRTTKLLGNVYFNTEVADKAIYTANDFKNKLNSTVYSIGLFDNANEDQLYGKYWYYRILNKIECFGKRGQYWGSSDVSDGLNFLQGYSIDPRDAYATNRMLAYISSDFNNPDGLGVTRGTYAPGQGWFMSIFGSGTGYRIDTSTYKYDDKGYYFGISPNTLNEDQTSSEFDPVGIDVSARLADVFKDIDVVTSVPKNTLDDKAVLLDSVTKHFDLVKSSVKAYDAPKGSTTGRPLAGEDLTVSNDEVRVKGFNYMEHWYNETTGESITDSDNTKDARHVIVTFDLKRKKGFIGGNSVPSNQKSSGIYDGTETMDEENLDGVLVEQFNIPKVDVQIKMEETRIQDQSAYYSTEQSLAELLNPVWLDGDRNKFVKLQYSIVTGDTTYNYIVPAGQSEGTWTRNGTPLTQEDLDDFMPQMTETKDYTVTCKVIPDPTGTVQPETLESEIATVFVFIPKITVENDTANANGKYPVYSDPSLSWTLDEKGAGDVYTAAQKADAETRLEKLEIPKVQYKIQYETNGNPVSTVTYQYVADPDDETHTQMLYQVSYDPATDTDIPTKTNFKVVDVTVTPNVIYYDVDGTRIEYYTKVESEEDTPELRYYVDTVTATGEKIWHSSDGTVLNNAPSVNDLTASEEQSVIIQKIKQRDTLNASALNAVKHLNSTLNQDTNGVFTINPYAHDVTLTNETQHYNNESSGFADKQKKFPMTLTLNDGNAGANGSFEYTLTSGGAATNGTITFTNGVADKTIDLADGDSIVLKNITHGYTLSVSSTPAPGDNYNVAYLKAVGEGATLSPVTDDTFDAEAESLIVTVNDVTNIKVIHSIEEIVITGLGNSDSKLNPFFIAAAIVALLGGTGTGYMVKRKKETEA